MGVPQSYFTYLWDGFRAARYEQFIYSTQSADKSSSYFYEARYTQKIAGLLFCMPLASNNDVKLM